MILKSPHSEYNESKNNSVTAAIQKLYDNGLFDNLIFKMMSLRFILFWMKDQEENSMEKETKDLIF